MLALDPYLCVGSGTGAVFVCAHGSGRFCEAPLRSGHEACVMNIWPRHRCWMGRAQYNRMQAFRYLQERRLSSRQVQGGLLLPSATVPVIPHPGLPFLRLLT